MVKPISDEILRIFARELTAEIQEWTCTDWLYQEFMTAVFHKVGDCFPDVAREDFEHDMETLQDAMEKLGLKVVVKFREGN